MHDIFANIRILAAAGADAVYHHGTQTDKFWREERIEEAREYLACMRDCGVAVGLGTHQPEIVEYAEEHGWDVDFYVASFYNLSRVPRESAAVTGRTDYHRERYLPEDREAMCRVIRAVSKPVIAIKVLAAGRHCTNQAGVREALRYAYGHIKPTDAVSVGLFPKHEDQTVLDLAYAEEGCRDAAASGG
jgi:hypothetical protein